MQQRELIHKEMYSTLIPHVLKWGELKKNAFPLLDRDHPRRASFFNSDNTPKLCLNDGTLTCVRCAKVYKMNSMYQTSFFEDVCIYHWGKLVKMQYGNRVQKRYRCCQGEPGSTGCEVAPSHVHHETKFWPYDYITTVYKIDRCPLIYAMDCEMVYTTAGMEVARVTLINSECDVVYETFVKPYCEIVDYNTRFSGIRESDLRNVQISLTEVQEQLLNYINKFTILVGHSLECDLRSLKIIHTNVIDTSVIYSERLGIPSKTGLKELAKAYLNMTIQDRSNGHDSKEDAVAAMKLVHYYYNELKLDELLEDQTKQAQSNSFFDWKIY